MFSLRGGTWSQTAELTASDAASNDDFGYSVALSALGATALIGSIASNSQAGAAYVFTLRGSTWSQTGELTASDAAPGNGFGVSVALSALGTTALIGSLDNNSLAGAAYVFTLQGSTWSQTSELTASDAAPDDLFGYSVALSPLGTTALIGSPGFLLRHPYGGAAYVFTGPA